LFFLSGVSFCGIANADITGNASLGYNLIEEDGDWSGDFEQRLNLSYRPRSGLGRLLGINLGFVWHGTDFDLLSAFSPTYSINLQGKSYSLSSGYSVRMDRGLIDSRLYENLSIFLPDLPTVRVAYSRQGTRDTDKERRVDTTGKDIQFGIEDEIGPFRVTLNRREYTTKDEIRGPEHDTESSNTSGDVTFTHSFGRLLSLNGRYGLEQLDTERASIGRTKGETENLSLGFRLSPIRTIALSGTTAKRREDRETSLMETTQVDEVPPVTKSDYLENRLQLMLQPIEGIRLGAMYSTRDTTREAGEDEFDESRSLTAEIEPLHELVFSGRFTIRDSQEDGQEASDMRQVSFDMRVKPMEKLQILARLNQSELDDFINELRNDRNGVTARLEAMLTENFRTDLSYDWQKSIKRLEGEVDKDNQHRLSLSNNYSFARILNVNFKISRNMSSERGSDNQFSGALSYVEDRFRSSLRYSRTSSPVRSSSLEQGGRRTTQTFAITLDQEVNQDTDLSLNYESRFVGTALGSRGTRRISFRVSSRL